MDQGVALGIGSHASSVLLRQAARAGSACSGNSSLHALRPGAGLKVHLCAQDFGGFRIIVLLPRFKPGWPPPGAYEDEAPKRCKALGAPRNPLPLLMPNGKPICAATIRAGVGFLEVPFFATQETRRNRGFGRALLEARCWLHHALPRCSCAERSVWAADGRRRSRRSRARWSCRTCCCAARTTR